MNVLRQTGCRHNCSAPINGHQTVKCVIILTTIMFMCFLGLHKNAIF